MKKRDTPAFFLVFLAHSKAVSLNFKNEEEGHRASFLVFWAHSKAVSLNTKNGKEGHRAFFLPFFFAHSKPVSLNFKNEEEGHRASFLVFWAHSKAVSLNTKNGEEGHRAFFFAVFAQLQKRCHTASKMKQRDTGPLFSFFWAHSKAVSLNTKNGEEGHRAFFLPFLLNFKSGVTLHQK